MKLLLQNYTLCYVKKNTEINRQKVGIFLYRKILLLKLNKKQEITQTSKYVNNKKIHIKSVYVS